MIKTIRHTHQFKKDLKRMLKRGKDIRKLDSVVEWLCAGKALPAHNRDHALTGKYAGFRDCHIEPDWLLLYQVDGEILVLVLSRTGTHSDIF